MEGLWSIDDTTHFQDWIQGHRDAEICRVSKQRCCVSGKNELWKQREQDKIISDFTYHRSVTDQLPLRHLGSASCILVHCDDMMEGLSSMLWVSIHSMVAGSIYDEWEMDEIRGSVINNSTVLIDQLPLPVYAWCTCCDDDLGFMNIRQRDCLR